MTALLIYLIISAGFGIWAYCSNNTVSVKDAVFVGLMWWVYLLIFIILLIVGNRSMG